MTRWLAFVHSLPSRGSSGTRVHIWRQLRRIGAMAGPGGATLLPDRAECRAMFTELRDAVMAAHGEAWILEVSAVTNWSDADLTQRASIERTREYEVLAASTARLESQLGGRLRATAGQRRTAAGLRAALAAIVQRDYFGAAGRAEVEERLRGIEQRLEGVQHAATPVVSAFDVGAYRSRRWVTSARPGVDALACTWLIRRSIDPNARIRYGEGVRVDEVGFAAPRGEFSGRGGRCAFQQIVYAFRLNSPALVRMGEIVREVDRAAEPYLQMESAGIAAALRGWRRMANLTDAEIEARARSLFDGLHASL
jgi:hypothetical protein